MLCVLVIYYLSAYVGGFTLEVEVLADQYVCHLSVAFSYYLPQQTFPQVFTARCTLVQSAVLRSHVVCLSVRLSVCNVGGL